ncbi:type II toxin-antitoxin system RelE/ParE family toxin [Mesorhizobium ciceri]|uniref:Type II toxin-antitoxin system RelE/ParE family toxin n=1 Tax=Mesorhizobium ciceri TaxID=39645 RepID=A0AB38TG60_9HYPH|nr:MULTISPECIES: type II toxin-antitoxin system RelE/ParE family toxin [Mesorhizobium]AMY02137.1 plasmid stabilization protein [Mesorhizobium ciceri biovar biserrulae]MBZ9892062.1 type II toxin-antitoxin system RelE/ParE family toxin [Mesorhizobium sp. BR1-1-3]MDF3215379.1 type II toxin-antitoxin system RelE/ParE family toxin [Mesorhizobium ciceri]UTU54031.1 type II toxin-antitoxin system RelE/ParE family toxin [Mesorhizobium ciceri]
MAVIFAPAAAQDVEEISDYIHAENPAAGRRFIAALRERCSRIADVPHGGVPRPTLWPGLRSFAFHRYVIFYTTDGDEVRVERVLHGARDIPTILEGGQPLNGS